MQGFGYIFILLSVGLSSFGEQPRPEHRCQCHCHPWQPEQQSVYRADHDHEARGSGECPQHTWICEHLESGSSQRHHPEAAVVRDDEGSDSQPYFTLAVFKLQGVLSFFPVLQLNSSSSLVLLGSLLIGIPSTTFSSISGMELLTASKNPSVVSHMVSAPQIVQQTFVAQV